MRHGWTMAPAGLLVVLLLVGAGPEPVPGEMTVPDGRFGSRTAPILLLSRPDVQIDLQLDARQIAAARSAIVQLMEQASSLRNQRGPAVPMARQRIDDQMVRWLNSTLSESQRERLLQINLQWEGAVALTRPHVVTHLRLTQTQSLAIDQVLKKIQARRAAQGAPQPAEIAQFTAQAQAILSPVQKNDWSLLLGPPCRFSISGQAVTTRSPTDPEVIKTRARSPR